MLSVKEPSTSLTAYEYDGLGRNTKITYPDSKTVVLTYNKNSQVATQTDPNGSVVTYTYNARSLLTNKSISRGT